MLSNSQHTEGNMLRRITVIQLLVDEARVDIDYELDSSAYNDKQRELLVQARHRLKQAWHLLDEAAEL